MSDIQSDSVPIPFPPSKPWDSEQPCTNLSSLHPRLDLQVSAPGLQLPPAFLGEGAAQDTEGCSFIVSQQTQGKAQLHQMQKSFFSLALPCTWSPQPVLFPSSLHCQGLSGTRELCSGYGVRCKCSHWSANHNTSGLCPWRDQELVRLGGTERFLFMANIKNVNMIKFNKHQNTSLSSLWHPSNIWHVHNPQVISIQEEFSTKT